MKFQWISRSLLVGAALVATVAVAQGAPKPAAAPAAAVAAAKPATEDPKDKALVEKMCSGCHDFGTVTSQSRTDVEWAETLDRMVGYGAQIAPDDNKRIQAFLAAHYGAKSE